MLGMAPWSKESTRLHAIAYMRGVAFHLGIFLGLAVLIASPWLSGLPQLVRFLLGAGAAAGALFGMAGLLARWKETNLKALSTPDDYFAVLIVSLFLGAEALWLFFPQAQTIFYLTSAAMLVYAPLGKIRHCLYYAASRLFYGKFIGNHAVLPHSQQGAR
jgi:nitrate reductase gamma subunit